jgi:hypothetical protein
VLIAHLQIIGFGAILLCVVGTINYAMQESADIAGFVLVAFGVSSFLRRRIVMAQKALNRQITMAEALVFMILSPLILSFLSLGIYGVKWPTFVIRLFLALLLMGIVGVIWARRIGVDQTREPHRS